MTTNMPSKNKCRCEYCDGCEEGCSKGECSCNYCDSCGTYHFLQWEEMKEEGENWCKTCIDEKKKKEEYDDKGVLCRYIDDEWFAIEDHCVTCGYRCDECECDEGEEDWVYPCEECGTHKKEEDLKCSVCLEKEEPPVSSQC